MTKLLSELNKLFCCKTLEKSELENDQHDTSSTTRSTRHSRRLTSSGHTSHLSIEHFSDSPESDTKIRNRNVNLPHNPPITRPVSDSSGIHGVAAFHHAQNNFTYSKERLTKKESSQIFKYNLDQNNGSDLLKMIEEFPIRYKAISDIEKLNYQIDGVSFQTDYKEKVTIKHKCLHTLLMPEGQKQNGPFGIYKCTVKVKLSRAGNLKTLEKPKQKGFGNQGATTSFPKTNTIEDTFIVKQRPATTDQNLKELLIHETIKRETNLSNFLAGYISQSSDSIYIIMKQSKNSLQEIIKKVVISKGIDFIVPEKVIRFILIRIVPYLKFLEKNFRICHGEVCAENVLVRTVRAVQNGLNGPEKKEDLVTLTDFKSAYVRKNGEEGKDIPALANLLINFINLDFDGQTECDASHDYPTITKSKKHSYTSELKSFLKTCQQDKNLTISDIKSSAYYTNCAQTEDIDYKEADDFFDMIEGSSISNSSGNQATVTTASLDNSSQTTVVHNSLYQRTSIIKKFKVQEAKNENSKNENSLKLKSNLSTNSLSQPDLSSISRRSVSYTEEPLWASSSSTLPSNVDLTALRQSMPSGRKNGRQKHKRKQKKSVEKEHSQESMKVEAVESRPEPHLVNAIQVDSSSTLTSDLGHPKPQSLIEDSDASSICLPEQLDRPSVNTLHAFHKQREAYNEARKKYKTQPRGRGGEIQASNNPTGMGNPQLSNLSQNTVSTHTQNSLYTDTELETNWRNRDSIIRDSRDLDKSVIFNDSMNQYISMSTEYTTTTMRTLDSQGSMLSSTGPGWLNYNNSGQNGSFDRRSIGNYTPSPGRGKALTAYSNMYA